MHIKWITEMLEYRVPLFSVVMATYQSGNTIKTAIDSILNQTECDWELIIVDDESTDDTAIICKEYIELDSRVHYIIQPHSGVASAKNLGVLNSSGKYVTFLDSDDEYLPTHLEVRRDFTEKYPDVDFFHGGVSVVGNQYVKDKNDFTQQVHVSTCAIGGTFVIRKTLFNKIGYFPDVTYAEDAYLYEHAKNMGIGISQIHDQTYIYYRNK